MKKVITRIAPTPSGILHIGNIYNFLMTNELKSYFDCEIHLRIDDFDLLRTKDIYLENIFSTLELLKIKIDYGPSGICDLKTNFSQQNKYNLYKDFILNFESYVCDCSRADLKKRSNQLKYDGHCRDQNKSFNKNSVIRFKSKNLDIEDFIIWRKEDIPSYQVVSLFEDEASKINFILRGNDLAESTKFQIELSKSLDKSYFADAKILHHTLILDNSGNKISKSKSSLPFNEADISMIREKVKIDLNVILSKSNSFSTNF